MSVREMSIAGREIGPAQPPYVIAEISANHLGDKGRAVALIEAAAAAGADAVKLQTYTADSMTVRSERPEFRIGGGTIWDGAHLHDLYTQAMTPWEWTEDLMAVACSLGIALFSSPFDTAAVDFLDGLDTPAFKIASFELIDLPLIRQVARTGKPMIISTGMASLAEIDSAVQSATGAGATEIGLLRCNSSYPAAPHQMDLRAIPVMLDLWSVPVGFSDHTLSDVSAIAAVALGASMIEKHLTLRRSDGGADGEFSCEPEELARLIAALRDAHASLGRPRFGPSESERATVGLRRSLRAVQPVVAGDLMTAENVKAIRPGGGLHPGDIDEVLGRRAARNLELGAPITWFDLTS